MYCIIKCIVQGKQARVKNADLRHPSCTIVMLKRKSASPVLNVLSDTRNIRSYVNLRNIWYVAAALYLYYLVLASESEYTNIKKYVLIYMKH